MNILVDKAMMYWQDYFSPSNFHACNKLTSFSAGDLLVNEYGDIANSKLKECLSQTDALLIRSTTKVNERLLSLMPRLKFVATATAGYDHLDLDALHKRNIVWHAAGGCNAQAVAQYVCCAVLDLATKDNFIIADKTIAVVGHGNVGSKVATVMGAFGAKVIVYDPPQAENVDNLSVHNYASFEEVVEADIICIHAPYNSHLKHPTYHMFGEDVLSALSSEQYIINAGRGELIDNAALLALFQKNEQKGNDSPQVVLDVWENEPNILLPLVKYLRLSTAHIAGHTLEGKARGTHIVYEHLCRFAKLEPLVELDHLLPEYGQNLDDNLLEQWRHNVLSNSMDLQTWLKKLCESMYLIQNDDSVFRASVSQSNGFATIRQQYPMRREFSALTIKAPNNKINKLLRDLGFIISSGS